MLRTCSHCKKSLDESDFNWKIKGVKRSYHCKECSRLYLKSHYAEHTKYYLDKAHKRNIFIRKQSHEYIAEYLLSHPCIDCGELNILVLEFDHKDNKIDNISTMIRRGMSFDKIIDEIYKCDVRCSNCHSIKTAKENNSWKLKYAPVAQLDRAPVFGTGFAGVRIPPGAHTKA